MIVRQSDIRVCVKCERSLPITDFYLRSDRKTPTPRGACKSCWRAQAKAYQSANQDRYRGYGRSYRTKVSRHERSLRQKFGMTLAEWEEIWEAQGRVCAICKGASNDAITHDDHDHQTGAFRGILCGLCNRMLGQGQDDPDRLIAGARYLTECT